MAMSWSTGTTRLLLQVAFRGRGDAVQSIPAWFLVPRNSTPWTPGADVTAEQLVTSAAVALLMSAQPISVPRMLPSESVMLATSRISVALMAAQYSRVPMAVMSWHVAEPWLGSMAPLPLWKFR